MPTISYKRIKMKSFKQLHEINLSNTAMTFLVYKFATLLKAPYTEWEAYKLGLIDENGVVIKKATTKKEKDGFSYLERFVLKIKKVLLKYIRSEKLLTILVYGFLLKSESVNSIAIVELKEKLTENEQDYLEIILYQYHDLNPNL